MFGNDARSSARRSVDGRAVTGPAPFITLSTGRKGFNAAAYQLEASGTRLRKVVEPLSSVLKALGLKAKLNMSNERGRQVLLVLVGQKARGAASVSNTPGCASVPK